MIFDKSRVYTAVNADELKIGSKVIVANSIGKLQQKVNTMEYEQNCEVITWIGGENHEFRFCISGEAYLLAYLVEEPQKQGLKGTNLKVGDILRNGTNTYMVVAINNDSVTCNVCLGGKGWVFNSTLEDDFELVTEDKRNDNT